VALLGLGLRREQQ